MVVVAREEWASRVGIMALSLGRIIRHVVRRQFDVYIIYIYNISTYTYIRHRRTLNSPYAIVNWVDLYGWVRGSVSSIVQQKQ